MVEGAKMISPEDYRYCMTCGMYFDFWKYGSVEDAGHAGCEVREVTHHEFWNTVLTCIEDGCFEDEHLDSKDNRRAPDHIPPSCPSCGEALDNVHWNQYDTYEFKNGEYHESSACSGETKCPYCGYDLGDEPEFEDGPANYHEPQSDETPCQK